MIRITRETDFGIVLLGEMSRHGAGQSHSARQAAEWTGISLPMTSKILKRLARGGLVTSNRGARGGYALAQRLERVSLADVIEALEGPIGLVECVAHPGLCEQEPHCRSSVNWKRVNQVVLDALRQVPVSEMVCGDSPAPALVKLERRTAGATR